ncbi:MAG: HAD family phosphatase [Proteobacteria bacterium]|nr:HAD family phosphatase [Pseudomonadota bacterium]
MTPASQANLSEVRALLFDLDGTLVDTAEANAMAYARALAEHGIDVPVAQVQELALGRNWRQFLPPLVQAHGVQADCERIAQRKRDLYASMVGGLAVNAGLLALLASCKPHKRIGLVTTASSANVQAIVQAKGWNGLFDVVVTGDDVGRHKPAPDAYLLAAQRLDLEPACCLAFEDSDIGAASALAAGMRLVEVRFAAAARP